MPGEYQPILKEFEHEVNFNFVDVDAKIIRTILKLHKAGKIKDWAAFKDYCMGLDVKWINKEEMIFLVPECVIDRCIEQAKENLTLRSPNEN
jgi:hypothetical protein